MNLVKVADMLKNASDQNLIQEIQNPSGSVPSYMVLSELERRKKLRGSLMNNEPQSSVAEDMEREAAPAAAGIGSMGQPPAQGPGYAGGGEVVHAAGGWWKDPADYENYDPTNPKMQRSRLDEMRAAIREQYGVDPENMGAMTSLGQGIGNFFGSNTAQNTAINEYESAKKGLNLLSQTNAAPAPALSADANKKKGDSTLPPAAPRASTPATPAAAPNSMASYLEEMKGYRKELEGMYKNQADLYQKQYEDLKGAKDKDVSMALLTAGLGIMGGRSAYAAENIGQGALPAVQQYLGADRERQREMQKMALGQGALGIESLRARMEATRGEGELGLKERAVGADEMKARAAMASAGAQSSYYKQAIASAKSENDAARIAASVINSSGFSMMDPKDQQFFLGMARQGLMNRFPGAGGDTGASIPTYNPQTRSW